MIYHHIIYTYFYYFNLLHIVMCRFCCFFCCFMCLFFCCFILCSFCSSLSIKKNQNFLLEYCCMNISISISIFLVHNYNNILFVSYYFKYNKFNIFLDHHLFIFLIANLPFAICMLVCYLTTTGGSVFRLMLSGC